MKLIHLSLGNEKGCVVVQAARRSGPVFNPRAVHVIFVVYKVALTQVCLPVFPFSPVSNIPSMLCTSFYLHFAVTSGPGSVVGITTWYELDGPGWNPGEGEISRTCPDRPWGPLSLLYSGYRIFPGGKVRPGRDADP